MSNSQRATETTAESGTSNENGKLEQCNIVHLTQSCHSRAERWEYDPDWTQEQQAELEKSQSVDES